MTSVQHGNPDAGNSHVRFDEGGCIPATRRKSLGHKTDFSLLRECASRALDNAYAPYSKFRVGAALLATDGSVHTGCNVENISFGLTNCAERTALFKAVSCGVRTFAALVVAAESEMPPYPCGACRQVLSEFCPPDMPVHCVALNTGETADFTLSELLPATFQKK